MDRLGDLEAMRKLRTSEDARSSADSESEMAGLVPALATTSSKVCAQPAAFELLHDLD